MEPTPAQCRLSQIPVTILQRTPVQGCYHLGLDGPPQAAQDARIVQAEGHLCRATLREGGHLHFSKHIDVMIPRILKFTLVFSLAGFSLLGAVKNRDLVREAEIERELAQKHPELVEPLRAATAAYDTENYAEAARLLRELNSKAPDYDVGLRRLGSCLVRLGQREEGLQLCERAIELNRSAENLGNLAFNLARNNSEGDHSGSYRRALSLVHEAQGLPHGLDLGDVSLQAELALRLDDERELEAATAILKQKFPNELATHYFTAYEAALNGKWVQAEKEMKKAEKLGLSHEAAQAFLDRGVHSKAMQARVVFGALGAFVFWVIGLVLLYGVGLVLSKKTLGQVKVADAQTSITNGERRMRKVYRVVLNAAGVYYYVSLPIVVALVLAVLGAILYFFLMIGRFPIKLTLLLVIGALVTIFAMIKSLFIRVKAEDPGRALQRPEAEGLWNLAQEVAQSVGTRPVDEIRITPGTDLAVYERGTWRQRLRDQGQRVLILGTGVLNGFTQDAFRAVLAHEYGHFSNRDTAGGDIGLRVRKDMINFFIAMYHAGQATWINVAFHFLRVYDFIFRRISHGATRLQEILADRVSAQIYGAQAFEAGLRHVIRRSLEFEAAAQNEIKQSVEEGRALQNFYDLAAPNEGDIESEFEKALNRPTTDDDTHPGPKDRFRLVAPLQRAASPPGAAQVWDLFADPEGIRAEMVEQVEKGLAPHRQQEGLAKRMEAAVGEGSAEH